MSVNPIDFDLPVWSAEIWHSERGATNPWARAFNLAPKDGEREAIKKARELFESDGLSVVTVYRIEVAPLIPIERKGGSDG